MCQDDDAHGSGCTRLQACVGPGQAYYDVDGKKIYCSATTCQEAAQEAVDLCADHPHSGCSIGGSSSNGTFEFLFGFGAIATLGATIRRRK